MKKNALALLFTASIALCGLSCQMNMDLLGNYWRKTDSFNINDYPKMLKKTGEDFRILILADIQMTYFSNSDAPEENFSAIPRSLEMIAEDIDRYKPDLLVLPGDNIAGAGFFNTIEAERLIAFLDGFKIPYAMTMGNHDGEGYFTFNDDNRKAVIARLFEKGKYSLFQKGPDNLGAGNYGVTITDETGGIIYSLILLDNGFHGGYFTGTQVEWYEWYVKGANKSAGRSVPSFAFFHIPLPETDALYSELKMTQPETAADYFREAPSGKDAPNYGMFQKMKELGSTSHIFFCHDHFNRFDYEYQGIHFVACLKTGICAGHDNDRIGTTLIAIKDDLTVTVEFKLQR